MYKSPIELIYEDTQYQIEEGIYKAVQKVDIKVDREELIKALEYDRGQYEKGYEDAKAERAKGKWIVDGHHPNYLLRCSACQEIAMWAGGISYIYPNFCPNCGADMRGEKDE